MSENWTIYCEESGDKEYPWKEGSSHYYIVSAILVRERDAAQLEQVIKRYKYNVLRMQAPLEWKKLKSKQKLDDKIISRFLRKIDTDGPEFLVTQVICDKHEIKSTAFKDKSIFMNYLYGLIFKRISVFLHKTNSRARLIIDRNTDKVTQDSLKNYLSEVTRYSTGTFPKYSKPQWENPENHPILGLTDFISGVGLKAFSDYKINVNASCKGCKVVYGIYGCSTSNFNYKRSFKQVVDWNYNSNITSWSWKGLMYHPYESRSKFIQIINPK